MRLPATRKQHTKERQASERTEKHTKRRQSAPVNPEPVDSDSDSDGEERQSALPNDMNELHREHSQQASKETAEENIVTSTSDIAQQEGKNPALEGQHPTAENTTAEIITENPITQTPSPTNNSANVIEAENNCEETAEFHQRPQRVRQPPSRFGYNAPENPATGGFNVQQNPIVEMIHPYDYIPPSPHPFYSCRPFIHPSLSHLQIPPSFGYSQMYHNQLMVMF